MGNWNRLLIVLDQTLGFTNKISSNVIKKWQGFDNVTQEHIIQLEYRVKVRPAEPPKAKRGVDLISTMKYREQNLMRELIKYIDKRTKPSA